MPTPTNTNTGTNTILCLHGYGTNASILRLQLRNLSTALEAHGFRLVIPDAPFVVASPGPGALPAFADGPRPFRRWHTDASLARLFGVPDGVVEEERRVVREVLTGVVEGVDVGMKDGVKGGDGDGNVGGEGEGREGNGDGNGGGRVVGVLGFSQGVGLAAGLCLDPELAKGVKFVVCLCGLYPALPVTDGVDMGSDKRIDLPSVHVLGTVDSWRGQAVKVMETYFVQEKVRKVECNIRHEVPSRPKDVAVVVQEILDMWQETQRREQIAQN